MLSSDAKTRAFVEKAKLIHGKTYSYASVHYLKAKTPVILVCKIHGKFTQTPEKHLRGQGCRKCGVLSRASKRSVSFESFIKRAITKHGNTYSYQEPSTPFGITSTVSIVCKQHGEFKQQAIKHVNGNGCPECAKTLMGKTRNTKSGILHRFNLVHGQRFRYSKFLYTGFHVPSLITCKTHGEFLQSPMNHLAGKGCPFCANDKRKLSQVEVIERLKDIFGAKYDYSRIKYTGIRDKIILSCKKHGEFSKPVAKLFCSIGCPKCSTQSGSSNVEKRIASWLKKEGLKVIRSDRKILDGKEIDILIPKCNVGIEINGLYWHSGKAKEYHQQKTLLAASKNVQLFHLWEHEVSEKAPIVKSMLRIKLGLAKNRIYARETRIERIDGSKAREFLNKNHLHGFVPATYHFALIHEGTIVSVLSMDKPRFNKHYEWEIIRFASTLNTVVIGGASKLFAYFVNSMNPSSIISYADLDHGNGGLYLHLGFVKKSVTEPGYFWLRDKQVIPRYQAQKHRMQSILGKEFDPSLSGRENMEMAGYTKVFNSGNAVYTWGTEASKC